MNPLDILNRTPKTNCGECGHPTCLAFAAAVSRAGLDINLCPYIDLQGLEATVLSSKPLIYIKLPIPHQSILSNRVKQLKNCFIYLSSLVKPY